MLRDAAVLALPEVDEAEHLISFLTLPDVGVRVAEHMAVGILSQEGVNSGPKLAENQRFEIAARPHLAVDLLVANLSGTPCPVKAAAAEGGGQRPACVSDMSDSLGVQDAMGRAARKLYPSSLL